MNLCIVPFDYDGKFETIIIQVIISVANGKYDTCIKMVVNDELIYDDEIPIHYLYIDHVVNQKYNVECILCDIREQHKQISFYKYGKLYSSIVRGDDGDVCYEVKCCVL